MKPIFTQSSNTRPAKAIRGAFLALSALLVTGAANAQNTPPDSINITGRVYNDADGLVNSGSIDGPSIGSVNNQPLYIYLIDNRDSVVGKTLVADNGTFGLRAPASRAYNVTLSSSNQSVGIRYPTLGLPIVWAPTAEGDNIYGDGTPDFTVSISSTVDKVLSYGIDQRPNGFDYTVTVDKRDANGYNHIPHLAFTGFDDEDGPYADGVLGRSIDLFQATGGNLYYNGSLISFTSANAASRIHNFDTALLRFERTPGAAIRKFRYSLVDDAGIPELVANDVTLSVALPVDLVRFEGRRENGINILEWATATERGNNGFFLERSIDGNVFQRVADIKSKAINGNSNTPNSYSYSDAITAQSARMYFYRLRQVDMDGTVTYSNTVKLTSANSGSTKAGNHPPLTLYPNPSTGALMLDWNTGAASYTVAVRNNAGTVVLRREIQANDGSLRTALDLSNLPSGNYFLTLRGGTEQQTRQINLMTR